MTLVLYHFKISLLPLVSALSTSSPPHQPPVKTISCNILPSVFALRVWIALPTFILSLVVSPLALICCFRTAGWDPAAETSRMFIWDMRGSPHLWQFMCFMETITWLFDGFSGSVQFHFNGSEWNFWMSASAWTESKPWMTRIQHIEFIYCGNGVKTRPWLLMRGK